MFQAPTGQTMGEAVTAAEVPLTVTVAGTVGLTATRVRTLIPTLVARAVV